MTEIRELRGGFESTNSEEFADGSFIIRNVSLLATGTWTDSVVRVPTYYSPEILAKFAQNWIDNSVFDRHSGGLPRSVQNKIGSIENIVWDSSRDAIVGDIKLHGLTQLSQDVIKLIQAKEAKYVSVEHGGDAKYNSATQRYEMTSIVFRGLAIVLRGACTKCTLDLSASEAEGEIDMVEEVEEVDVIEEVIPEFDINETAVLERISVIEQEIMKIAERLSGLENVEAPALSTINPTSNELAAPTFEIEYDKYTRTIRQRK